MCQLRWHRWLEPWRWRHQISDLVFSYTSLESAKIRTVVMKLTNPKDWSTALMKQVLPRFLSPTKFLSCFWLISFRAFLASEGRFSTPFDPSTDKDLLRLLPVSDFETESLDSSPPLTMLPLQTFSLLSLPPPPPPPSSPFLLKSIKTLRIWFSFSDGVSFTTKSSQE